MNGVPQIKIICHIPYGKSSTAFNIFGGHKQDITFVSVFKLWYIYHHVTVRLVFFSGKESDYRRVLKPDGQEILMLAISTLEAVEGLLKDGAIQVQMLSLIKDNSERFLLVCEQISKEENKKSSLRRFVDQRCFELIAFQQERDKARTFIRMCSFLKQGNYRLYFGFVSRQITMFSISN